MFFSINLKIKQKTANKYRFTLAFVIQVNTSKIITFGKCVN